MNKKQKEKLKEMIKEGKWNYVAKYGSQFALFGFVFFWFFTKFVFEEEFYVTLNIIIWGMGGLIYGLWTWKSINKKVKKK
jgi:hypothetical protein